MCSHGLPVPDITEQYYGSQLPPARGERADVNQGLFFAGGVVVRETRHCSTGARPWHGLPQPGQQWPSAKSLACVRPRRAGIEPAALLAIGGANHLGDQRFGTPATHSHRGAKIGVAIQKALFSLGIKERESLAHAACHCPDHGWRRWLRREDRPPCAVSPCPGLSASLTRPGHCTSLPGCR